MEGVASLHDKVFGRWESPGLPTPHQPPIYGKVFHIPQPNILSSLSLNFFKYFLARQLEEEMWTCRLQGLSGSEGPFVWSEPWLLPLTVTGKEVSNVCLTELRCLWCKLLFIPFKLQIISIHSERKLNNSVPDSGIDAAGEMGCLYLAAFSAWGERVFGMQHLSGLGGGLTQGSTSRWSSWKNTRDTL